jgi:1-acyl-sn-glycerol-3-phosphate acyltransferase
LAKKVVIVAPHTSAYDFYIGILVKFWLNIQVKFYGKKELFRGLQGWLLRQIGGLPVDRSQNNNLVDTIVNDFNNRKTHSILLAPEGTRKYVEHFRSGFYHVADKANVPIIPIAFDFGKKVIRIMDPFITTGDIKQDLPQIEALFYGVKGKNPHLSFT